jgi:hypothetical protein
MKEKIMANTTFSGPVRSQNGFQTVSINATTGVVTTSPVSLGASGILATPVALADGNATLTAAANAGGMVNLVPNGTQDNVYTLPAPVAGTSFSFVYAGGAADATGFTINTGANANFFIGGLTFHDTDTSAVSLVYSDGNSNSKVFVDVPGAANITVVAKNGTNWQIFGTVVGATAPAFADQ